MKKTILLFLVVFVLLSVVTVPAYAYTIIPNPPSDVWEYWVIYDDGIKMRLVTSNSPITVSVSEDLICATGGYKRYYYEENQWVFLGEGNATYSSMETIYSSNHDIAYNDGSGFFFFKIPLLCRTMKATDFWAILRNFSAGLIPVVGCLILVISLRKGWEFLRSHLTT